MDVRIVQTGKRLRIRLALSGLLSGSRPESLTIRRVLRVSVALNPPRPRSLTADCAPITLTNASPMSPRPPIDVGPSGAVRGANRAPVVQSRILLETIEQPQCGAIDRIDLAVHRGIAGLDETWIGPEQQQRESRFRTMGPEKARTGEETVVRLSTQQGAVNEDAMPHRLCLGEPRLLAEQRANAPVDATGHCPETRTHRS
jgi:hypothetical protein